MEDSTDLSPSETESGAFLTRISRYLDRMLTKWLGSDLYAEDIRQDTLLAELLAHGEVTPESRLFIRAKHRAQAFLRKEHTQKRGGRTIRVALEDSDASDPDASIPDVLQIRALVEFLALPTQLRLAIGLVVIWDVSRREAADELGVHERTVYRYVDEGLKRLKRRME